MAELNWTEEAHRWLRDIHDYIAANDRDAAFRVVTGIYEKAQILRSYPEIGYIHKNDSGGVIRILLFGHYRIAYLVKADRDIDILGVFHGALNLENYLL